MERNSGALEPSYVEDLVRRALHEDLGDAGDITSKRIIRIDQPAKARIFSKEEGTLAGSSVAEAVFHAIDRSVHIDWQTPDGARLFADTEIAVVRGRARAIFAAERVALNFLQHLSGVASLTHKFAEACAKHNVKLLCTRKTLPGLRAVQRYAVAIGGGELHRAGLYDAILIKTNHEKLAGGLAESVRRMKANPNLSAEVEVSNMEEVEAAIEAGADRLLLDNADPATIKQVVARTRGKIFLEVSGGVTLKNVASIARCKPDAISVGAITHSVPAIDMALHVLH